MNVLLFVLGIPLLGGLVLAFVGPAVWLGQVQAGKRGREAALDAGSWLLVYLAMGTVFWMMR